MKRFKTIGLCFILISTIVFLAACSKQSDDKQEEILVPVSTYNAQMGDIQKTNSLSAKIKPIKEISVIPKIPGKVKSAMKGIGEEVAEGEILFTVETDDLHQQLEQINAQVAQNQALIEIAQINLNRAQGIDIGQEQVEAGVKQAEINYNSAKDDYEKNQSLFQSGAISKQMLDAARDRYELAEVQYKLAVDSSKLSLDSAKAQLNQTASGKDAVITQKQMIMQKIEDSVIKSPIKGVVIQKNIERGEIVSQQVPAYIVVDIDSVVIETNVTERIINKIQKGQEVLISIKALEGKQFKGTIDAISPAVSGQMAGYTVKILVENKNHEIKPGMFAQVDFAVDKKEKVLLIPMEAVMSEKGKEIVYVLNGETAVKREIKSGMKDGKDIEIVSGLKQGEQVIIKGQHFIGDGQKVNPVGGGQQ